MRGVRTLQDLFGRHRRPGDLVFAVAFLALSAFLLASLGEQTVWAKGTTLAAQPRFWPALSLGSMTLFAALHAASSLASPRIEGRWREVGLWLRSLEYVAWFLAYVVVVPLAGYLPSTVVFLVALALRAGYRDRRTLLAAAGAAVAVVLLFRTFLQVKVPGGRLYELLPGAARSFMLTYF